MICGPCDTGMPRIERIRVLVRRQEFLHLSGDPAARRPVVMCETKNPSWHTICGRSTRGSSPMRYASRWLSNASCASQDQPMSQPMSRVDSASVCSDPKSPGGSRRAVGNHHLHTACGCRRSASRARRRYCTPTPELPVNTRAPHRRRAVRDAQLRVLAVGHDVLGVELAVRHHLRQRHHRRGVGTDRIRGDDVHVRVVRGLRRRHAAVDADRSLLAVAVAM